MKSLFIDNSGHQGLGDIIILNGMIRHFAKEYDKVSFYSPQKHWPSIRAMFSDIGNKIEYWEGKSDPLRDSHTDKILLGDITSNFRTTYNNFCEGFYLQAGLSYNVSYDEFYMPQSDDSYQFSEPYLIYHSDLERGYQVDPNYFGGRDPRDGDWAWVGTSAYKDKPISAWVPALAKAKELHLQDSCFFHLCERIPTTGKLYFHSYVRGGKFDRPNRHKDWIVLE